MLPAAPANKFKYPIDFNPVGLGYLLENTDFSRGRLNDTPANRDYLTQATFAVNDTHLHTFLGVDKDGHQQVQMSPENLSNPARQVFSRITFSKKLPDGSNDPSQNFTYVVKRFIGGGSYGSVAAVDEYFRRPDGTYEARRKNLSMKRQTTIGGATNDLFPFVKEAMIHNAIYQETKDATDESIYVPNFIKLGVQKNTVIRGGVIYFITERMADTLRNIVNALPTVEEKADELVRFYRDITPKLGYLYDNCNYSHGDFKDDNVMKNFAGIYKLIDFGFSRLTITDAAPAAKALIQTSVYNDRDDPSRDLTQMTYYLSTFNLKFNLLPGGFDSPGTPYFLRKVMERITNVTCSGIGTHAAHDVDFLAKTWGDTYDYFNTDTNIYGTPQKISIYLDWITDPAKANAGAQIPGEIAAVPAGKRVAPLPPPPVVVPPPPAPAAPLVVAAPPPDGFFSRRLVGFVAGGVVMLMGAALLAARMGAFGVQDNAPPGPGFGGRRNKKVKRVTRKNRRQIKSKKHVSRKWRR
jgi:hypothetical protein